MWIIKSFVLVNLLICISNVLPATTTRRFIAYEHDPCKIKKDIFGICSLPRNCPDLRRQMQNFGLSSNDVVRCGFTAYEEIICCPITLHTNVPFIFNTTDEFLKTSNNFKNTNERFGAQERKTTKACRLLEDLSEPYTAPHVLGGSPVAPGEYPHMAAIGYTSINNGGPPYEIRCGGILIDKRFVLTAAHCVNRRDFTPIIVRLGVTNFNDTNQMRNVVDVPIKTVHVHKEYNSLQKYNDIAIIELENEIEYSSLIFPVCLHTDLADPPKNVKLNVTGWGTTNMKTRDKSDILLTTRVRILALEHCNASFARERILPSRGIQPTQMCTHDPTLTSDACWGDSGGPLNLIIDENSRKMKVIGIISAGNGCASVAPSLYTRIAAYLDFIEDVVWKDL